MSGYRGKRERRWPKVLLALILAGVLCFGTLLGAVLTGARDQIRGDPQIMIILGCQVKPWGPSILLQDRLDKALSYLEDHPDLTVVVSGGQGPGEPMSEARAMYEYLVENDVEGEKILLEEDSHNTWQNMRNTYALLTAEGYDPHEGILVVSNGFHLTRTRMLAGRAGFWNVSALSAPSSHTPTRLKMYIREPLALVKSTILDR